MIQTLLAVDTGYSFVKYSYKSVEDTTGEVIKAAEKGKFVTAIATVDTVGDLGIGEKAAVEYNGDYYLVGEPALNRSSLIPTRSESFLIEYSPLLIHEILRRENIQPTLLVVSLSLAEFARKRDALKKACSNFKVDGKVHSFDVEVMPQGWGIWVYANKPANAMIIDIGFNTIDILTVFNGKIMPEFCMGIRDFGVCEIANAVSNYINAKFDGIHVPELALVDVLNVGKFKYERQVYDISDIIEKRKKNYTETIFTMIKNSTKLGSIFNQVDDVILAGGGAYFIDGGLREKYRFTVVDDPEFANTLGFLKAMEERYGK